MNLHKSMAGKVSLLLLVVTLVAASFIVGAKSTTPALADSGAPVSITASYNTFTHQLFASGDYSAPCDKRLVGLALFINGANPNTSLPNDNVLEGAGMHIISDNCTPSGSWTDNNHNSSTNSILSTAPAKVCAVIYDIHLKSEKLTELTENIDSSQTSIKVKSTTGIAVGDTIEIENEYLKVTVVVDATTLTVTRGYSSTTAVEHKKKKDDVKKVIIKDAKETTGAGSDHNKDNSFQNNKDSYPEVSCVIPTIVEPSPTPTATPITTPTASPTASPAVPTAVPTTPSCGEDEHLDLSGTKCLRWELGGPPPPPSVTGQVLGASTMAGTGVADDTLFSLIFILGCLTTSLGVRKIASARV